MKGKDENGFSRDGGEIARDTNRARTQTRPAPVGSSSSALLRIRSSLFSLLSPRRLCGLTMTRKSKRGRTEANSLAAVVGAKKSLRPPEIELWHLHTSVHIQLS